MYLRIKWNMQIIALALAKHSLTISSSNWSLSFNIHFVSIHPPETKVYALPIALASKRSHYFGLKIIIFTNYNDTGDYHVDELLSSVST